MHSHAAVLNWFSSYVNIVFSLNVHLPDVSILVTVDLFVCLLISLSTCWSVSLWAVLCVHLLVPSFCWFIYCLSICQYFLIYNRFTEYLLVCVSIRCLITSLSVRSVCLPIIIMSVWYVCLIIMIVCLFVSSCRLLSVFLDLCFSLSHKIAEI